MCAEALRTYFCGGAAAAMARPYIMSIFYLSYAALHVRRIARAETMCREWVHKLSSCEFADELVVMAVALELQSVYLSPRG